jgi:hypothetical protein
MNSIIDSMNEYNAEHWLVSQVLHGEHALLLIEGIDESGPFIRICDFLPGGALAPREDVESMSSTTSVISSPVLCFTSTAKGTTESASPDVKHITERPTASIINMIKDYRGPGQVRDRIIVRRSDISREAFFALYHLNEHLYHTWPPITAERGRELIDRVRLDKESPPRFHFSGRSEAGEGYNCISWVISKLVSIGIPAKSEDFKNTTISCIGVVPSTQVKGVRGDYSSCLWSSSPAP